MAHPTPGPSMKCAYHVGRLVLHRRVVPVVTTSCMHTTRQRLAQVVAERPTCVCVSPHMHVCALAVRHKQVELLQALVDVNQCKADAHGDQPVIRGTELAEGPLQVQEDASCWECRGGGAEGRAGVLVGVTRVLCDSPSTSGNPAQHPAAVIDQSTLGVFSLSVVVAG